MAVAPREWHTPFGGIASTPNLVSVRSAQRSMSRCGGIRTRDALGKRVRAQRPGAAEIWCTNPAIAGHPGRGNGSSGLLGAWTGEASASVVLEMLTAAIAAPIRRIAVAAHIAWSKPALNASGWV